MGETRSWPSAGTVLAHLARGVVGVLLAAHLVLMGLFQITDGDTWWHLKQGELYVSTMSLPESDPFAYTTAGREWIKYSWLADLGFYLLYRLGGATALVVFRFSALLLISLTLYLLFRRCGLSFFLALLLVYSASVALRFRLLIRPEILSFLLLLACLTILLRLKTVRPWAAYALLPVQVAWVNVHGSYLFGIALPLLTLAANLMPGNRWAPGWGLVELDRPRLRQLALAVACLPIVSLANPQGIATLRFPFRQNTMTDLGDFLEWMPLWKLPTIRPLYWEPLIIFCTIVVFFVGVSCLLWARERRVDPIGWGILLALGTYAVSRNRAVPYFALAILPFLALALARATRHNAAQGRDRLPKRPERIVVLVCLGVFGFSVIDQAFLTWKAPWGLGVRPDYFPTSAVTFMEKNSIDGRVFNAYEFGGYLIWCRWPRNQVFIDGRYDRILYSEALMADYRSTYQSSAALRRVALKYGAEILLLNTNPFRRSFPLDTLPGWARVYWDTVAEVFVQRGSRFASLIEQHEYRLTHTEFDLEYLAAYRGDAGLHAQAMRELRRAVAENPENTLAWEGLAQEYAVMGPSAREQRLEALTRATTLLRGIPGVAGLHSQRAAALLDLGRLEEAVAAARQALQADGSLLPPRQVLAAAAERQENWLEARNQLREILRRLDPNDPERQSLQIQLETAERRLRNARSP